MKWIVCSVLIFLGTSFFAADENKDHNYSPGLSKRSSGDTESGKDYVGYSDESNFNNFDREKSNTYKMSVSPPSGGTFIPESTCSGEVTKDEANLVEGKKIYSKNSIPTATYIISMSGQVSFGGGAGAGGSPATWGAYVRNKYFWLEPIEKIVAEGTAVTITANGVSAESTWTVNNKVWKDWRDPNSSAYTTSAISLNRDMWDKMQWTPTDVSTNWLCPPAGIYNIFASTTEESGARSAGATVFVMKIITSATDLFGPVEKNSDGTNKTAYVHWNIDNDNNATSSQSGKHPDADYLKTSAIVSGENDLKSFSFSLYPTLDKGIVEISIGNNGKVWKNAEKGASSGTNSQLLLAAGAIKIWDLSDSTQRNEFNSLGTLFMEGVGGGNETFTVKYKDDKGVEIVSDSINYTFIAANCGNQPTKELKTNDFARLDLVGCEWSVLSSTRTWTYNCIAWSVGENNVWYNSEGADTGTYIVNGESVYVVNIAKDYGNKDGTFNNNKIIDFYQKKGYDLIEGANNADVVYYSGYHGAKKRNCSCGSGKWLMFESKCGSMGRVEHPYDKIGGIYGNPALYWKKR